MDFAAPQQGADGLDAPSSPLLSLRLRCKIGTRLYNVPLLTPPLLVPRRRPMERSPQQIASQFGRDQGDPTRVDDSPVRACRLVGLFGAGILSLVGLLRLVLPIQAADPVWACFGVAGGLAGLYVVTHVAPELCDRAASWIQAGLYLVMVWAVSVVILNYTTEEYVLGLLLVYAGLIGGVGLSGRSARAAWRFAVGGLLITGVGFFLGPAPEVHPGVVLGGMAAAAIGAGGATQAHLSIQEHLLEQQGQWQHLVENLQEAVLITVEGEIVYANPHAATLFGASDPGMLEGESVFDLVALEAREGVKARLTSIHDGQSTAPYEHRTQGLDGSERVVQSQSVPVQYRGTDAALSVVRDVTHWRDVQDTLTQRAELEHLLVEVSAGFIDTSIERLDHAIEEALGTVGSFVGADRSYVFLFDGNPAEASLEETTMSNTHEWCASGVSPQKDHIQGMPCARLPWWMEQIRRQEAVVVPSLDDLPAAATAEKEVFAAQNIESLVALPLTQGDRLVGFVGFDAVGQATRWEEETVTVLRVLGDAIASALQRKEIEARLRDREERLRAITENVSEGIYRSTPDEGLVFANQAFAEMFGYDDAEEVLEVDPNTLYPTAQIREQLRTAARGQDSFDGVEATFQRADGSTFVGLVSGSVVRDNDGEVKCYDGAVTDITERKAQQRRLRVLSEAVEQAEDGILITKDASPESIIYANPAFEEMTGYREDELLGQSPEILRGPDTDPDVIDSLQKARAAGEPWTGETVNYQKDGTPFMVHWTAVPVRNDDGTIEYWTAVQRDVTERRTMEARLREREARLRGLANSIPGVVYQFHADPDGTYGTHFVSNHAEDLLGIPAEPDRFFDAFLARVPTPHRDRLLESVEEAVAQNDTWRFEIPFQTPTGEWIWLLGTATPERRENELVYNGVLLDITERKEAEKAVREERDRFETLFESLPTPVVRCTADEAGLQIADVNDAFKSVFGVDRTEAEAQSLDELLMPDGTGGVGIDRRALTEGAVRTDVQCETTDGPRDFRIQVAGRNPETGPPEGHAIYTDITTRKRRERALKETNATLEAILENLPLGVLAEDGEGGVLAANESFCEILGLPVAASALRGQEATDVMEKAADMLADPDAFKGRTEAILERGEPVFDEELALADGRVLERDFVPYELADGTAALWVYRDVTERKEREKRLKEAKDEAQEANRMKSVFLANMSHEIRTPLTSMIGFAEVIGDEVETDEEGPIPRFANLIEESGHRLMETLDAVLNLSKLEAGEMELSAEPVSLPDELNETAELFAPQARDAGIDLQVQTPDQPLQGCADPGGLRIVLRNLISNALKYTEEGSVWVRAEQRNGSVAVEVEDTGIGMNPDQTSALFEAFRQESEGIAREYEGSGLGLAVTKRVVDQMGGAIDVTTEKGKGTCFTVKLPRE